MDDVKLTYRARKLLAVLYNEYGRQLKAGKTELEAVLMGSPNEIQGTLLRRWSCKQIVAASGELAAIGFLELIEGDDDVQDLVLSRAAITWMDARGSRRAQTVWSVFKTVFSLLRR